MARRTPAARGGHARAVLTSGTVVGAARDAVYELIANPHRRAQWLPELDATAAPDRVLVPGDRFDGYSSLLAHRFVGQSEVVAAQPGAHLEERVVIGARFVTRWELHAVATGGTRVVHTVEIEFPQGTFGRVERWILARRLRAMQRDGLARLARAVAD